MTEPSGDFPSSQFPSLDVDELLDWVSSRTGLSFRGQRENAAETIRQYIDSAGDTSLAACRQRLEQDQAAFDDLIGALTIGETYFFRDTGQFELIAGEFLGVMRKIRPSRHRLRVWSAGCASGEEAWSLAAVLMESSFGKSVHVLGTDISRPALIRAQAGRYRQWSMRSDAADKMRRWINEHDDGVLEISEGLRPHVSFEYLNLAADTYPSFATNTVGLDLILCRNVLIYFDERTIQNVAERLFACLSPGGWLITGASDPALDRFADFEVRSTRSGRIYVRPKNSIKPKAENERAATHPPRTPLLAPEPKPEDTLPSTMNERESPPLRPASSDTIEEAEQALSRGAYIRVLKLTTDLSRARSCVLRVRALANLDIALAEEICGEAIRFHSSNKELQYLHAILLTELNRYPEAVKAAQQVVSLDSNLAVGHMALGTALQRIGDREGARRAFRSVKRICQSRRAGDIIPLSDGEQAGRLAESAARHLSLLREDLPRDGYSSVRW